MHASTYDFLNPTNDQKAKMAHVREAAAEYAQILNDVVPDGPDKTYLIRKLREVTMWANVAITRHPDGSPREASHE